MREDKMCSRTLNRTDKFNYYLLKTDVIILIKVFNCNSRFFQWYIRELKTNMKIVYTDRKWLLLIYMYVGFLFFPQEEQYKRKVVKNIVFKTMCHIQMTLLTPQQ